MNHKGTVILETKRLILRRFQKSDAEAMFRNWASFDEVTKYLTWPAHAKIADSEEILEQWIKGYEKEDYYQWAIVLKEDKKRGEAMGSIGVVDSHEKAQMAHIGYATSPKIWGQGMTPEALQCVLDFLFDEVGYNCIQARHDIKNINSGRVMIKCGMKKDGVLRQGDWNNQGICDAAYYSILANER